jgi:hypothetical protein
MKKQKGGRFHPSRISGHQKFLRAKQANEEIEKTAKIKEKKGKDFDMKNGDWSLN